ERSRGTAYFDGIDSIPQSRNPAIKQSSNQAIPQCPCKMLAFIMPEDIQGTESPSKYLKSIDGGRLGAAVSLEED
ncbi:MAG: hypothetical protein WCL16_11105, partial [bacterium]